MTSAASGCPPSSRSAWSAAARAEDDEEIEPALVTRHLQYSLPYRSLFSHGLPHDSLPKILDALVVLLVRLHLSGFFWGDVSLSNVLFRRSAGEFAAYLVDAETGELHETLSPGQRAHDLEVALTNIYGELLDLQAGDLLSEDFEADEIVERLEERYEGLWAELTGTEEFTTDEIWRIEQRIERLNDLGFDVDELDIVTDWDGATVKVQPKVVEANHHARELQRLTGLDVEENQARRLLNDLAAFTAWYDLGGEDRAIVAHRWLTTGLRADHRHGAAGAAREARARRGVPRDPRAPVVPVRAGRQADQHRGRRPQLHRERPHQAPRGGHRRPSLPRHRGAPGRPRRVLTRAKVPSTRVEIPPTRVEVPVEPGELRSSRVNRRGGGPRAAPPASGSDVRPPSSPRRTTITVQPCAAQPGPSLRVGAALLAASRRATRPSYSTAIRCFG